MKFTKYFAAGLFAAASLTACSESFLEDIEYTDALDEESAAEAAGKNPDVFLNGAWSWMVTYSQTNSSSHDDFGYMGSLHATDMMGQDICMGSAHWFSNDYLMDNNLEAYRRTSCHWTNYYTMIAKANEILSLYPEGGETAVQKGLIGQAQAMRGLAYMHLIQLYQFPTDSNGNINASAPGVPLMYVAADGKTDEEIAAAKGRNTVGDVLAQVEKDLLNAVENLKAGYERPNKNYIDASVANGFLARYYLLTSQWEKAASTANKARQGYPIMEANASGLYDGFVNLDNGEWMWGFAHTTETQTTYASFFSMISNLAPGYAGLGYAPRLIDAKLYSQIPDTDARKKWFVGPEGDSTQPTAGARRPYANIKFGHKSDWTDNYMYMRAAEMVLIEAEAYAHLNQGAKAAEVLKVLMEKRQPDWNEASVTVEDVYLQRRIELWGEGFSFYDLKRLNKGIDRTYAGNNHLDGYKIKVPAGDTRWIYQLPLKEIQENDLINEEDQNQL